MLDDRAALRAVDRSDMLSVLAGLPEQVRQSAQAGARLQPRSRGPFTAVCFAAMGGSAMGADVAAAWLARRSSLPCAVVRDYDAPAWAGRGALLVAVSYSGNTEETLDAARQAHERGAHILAVTSGGALASWAEGAGGDVVRVPAGLQPRAALGHLAFATLGALEGLGLASVGKDAEGVAAHLERVRAQLSPEQPEAQNPAKQLARALHGKIGFVYGAGLCAIAARRIATQLNENSKELAHWGPIPEVHHNELSAWFGDPRLRTQAMPVVVQAEPPTTPLGARERATAAVLREAGAAPWLLEAQGDTALARAFHAIYVGDYASIYLACLLGRDPTPVDAIQKLKQRMAEFRRPS
ncbi:MAG TPA: bifunctional phosphoglucose/phosphomannose isomerase [Candidatus Thermoplasmatota archaeon]|jgi:glucose/mannose-6-phosphate isomerase|nr:bifunctional phosphoglucose/phosphomannose isomerase [Candidatus Thermoplasmatota archaeon]